MTLARILVYREKYKLRIWISLKPLIKDAESFLTKDLRISVSLIGRLYVSLLNNKPLCSSKWGRLMKYLRNSKQSSECFQTSIANQRLTGCGKDSTDIQSFRSSWIIYKHLTIMWHPGFLFNDVVFESENGGRRRRNLSWSQHGSHICRGCSCEQLKGFCQGQILIIVIFMQFKWSLGVPKMEFQGGFSGV